MLRTPFALLFLLTPLVGCGEGSGLPRDEANAEAQAAEGSPAAPFRDDVRLAQATLGRPWRPPEDGPVPVVEVLRDGSWLLNGVPVREAFEDWQGGDDSARLRAWLARQAELMPQRARDPDWPEIGTIGANPVLLRIDRDARWGAVRPVLNACQLTGIDLVDLEFAVAADVDTAVHTVYFETARNLGMSNYGQGIMAYRGVCLERPADPQDAPQAGVSPPASLWIWASRNDEERERFEVEEVTCSSRAEFTRALQELIPWGEGSALAYFPDDAPWWSVLVAIECAIEAGLSGPYGLAFAEQTVHELRESWPQDSGRQQR